MRQAASLVVVVVASVAACALAGCVRVRAHERQVLAHPALAQPASPEQHAAHQHVYQIREGADGATGAGGGGCGCN